MRRSARPADLGGDLLVRGLRRSLPQRRHLWLLVLGGLSLQACMASAPPIAGEPRARQLVRLRSPVPFSVRLAGDVPGAPTCRAYRVEGVVRTVATDTIWFQSLSVLDRAPASPSCERPGSAYIVTSEVRQGETTIRRFSPGRTVVIIVVGLPLAAAALYALICGSSATACYN